MKKAKKCLALFLVIGIVLALFCACGEDSEPKTKEELLTAHPWGMYSDYAPDSDSYSGVINFSQDGSFIRVFIYYPDDAEGETEYDVSEGTWSIKGDTFYFKEGDYKQENKFKKLSDTDIDNKEHYIEVDEWYVSDKHFVNDFLVYQPMSDSDFDSIILAAKAKDTD